MYYKIIYLVAQDPSRKNNITPKECNMNNENTSI